MYCRMISAGDALGAAPSGLTVGGGGVIPAVPFAGTAAVGGGATTGGTAGGGVRPPEGGGVKVEIICVSCDGLAAETFVGSGVGRFNSGFAMSIVVLWAPFGESSVVSPPKTPVLLLDSSIFNMPDSDREKSTVFALPESPVTGGRSPTGVPFVGLAGLTAVAGAAVTTLARIETWKTSFPIRT